MQDFFSLTVSDAAREFIAGAVTDESRRNIEAGKEDSTYELPQAALHLPFDHSHLAEVLDTCAPLGKEEASAVVVLGIGGSNLGARALYEALRTRESIPFFFLDTCHSALFEDYKAFLSAVDPRRVAYFYVSKSGATIETNVLRTWVTAYLEEKGWHLPERWISITKDGDLLIPENVGGRYSVFSAAGLGPLYFLLGELGLKDLLAGARSAFGQMDAVAQSAEVLFGAEEAGYAAHDTFLFHPRLEMLGAWYRQLAAESLGKDGQGLLPTVSLGSRDLHSVAQLYFGGRRNIITSFVTVPRGGREFDAITRGVLSSYQNEGLPYAAWYLREVSPAALGAWMQAKMIETMLMGDLMGVNAFDQPAVELYKAEVREILGGA